LEKSGHRFAIQLIPAKLAVVTELRAIRTGEARDSQQVALAHDEL
jgi:hypothetical protein